MTLPSLNAKTWTIVSQSPLVIESIQPGSVFGIRLFENRKIELLSAVCGEPFTEVNAELDLASLQLSTSNDEQYLYLNCAKSGNAASVKREDEGVVVDVIGLNDDQDVASCCAFYCDLQPVEDDE